MQVVFKNADDQVVFSAPVQTATNTISITNGVAKVSKIIAANGSFEQLASSIPTAVKLQLIDQGNTLVDVQFANKEIVI